MEYKIIQITTFYGRFRVDLQFHLLQKQFSYQIAQLQWKMCDFNCGQRTDTYSVMGAMGTAGSQFNWDNTKQCTSF